MSQEDLKERVRNIELLLMDVDGVLTDGKVWFVPSGDDLVEVKSFSVLDGAGIALAHRAGLKTGVVSARSSPGVRRRAEELSMEFVYLDVSDKKTALEQILGGSACVSRQGLLCRRRSRRPSGNESGWLPGSCSECGP